MLLEVGSSHPKIPCNEKKSLYISFFSAIDDIKHNIHQLEIWDHSYRVNLVSFVLLLSNEYIRVKILYFFLKSVFSNILRSLCDPFIPKQKINWTILTFILDVGNVILFSNINLFLNLIYQSVLRCMIHDEFAMFFSVWNILNVKYSWKEYLYNLIKVSE